MQIFDNKFVFFAWNCVHRDIWQLLVASIYTRHEWTPLSAPLMKEGRARHILASHVLTRYPLFFIDYCCCQHGGVKKHNLKRRQNAEKAREARKRKEKEEESKKDDSTSTTGTTPGTPVPSTSHAHTSQTLTSSAKRRRLDVRHASRMTVVDI